MATYGLRYDPKLLTAVSLSMVLPNFEVKKFCNDIGIEVSDRTIRRAKKFVQEWMPDSLLDDVKKAYAITNVSAIFESEITKKALFEILNNPNSQDRVKIQAATALYPYIHGTKSLFSLPISESLIKLSNQIKEESSKSDTSFKDEKDGKNDKICTDLAHAGEALDADANTKEQAHDDCDNEGQGNEK